MEKGNNFSISSVISKGVSSVRTNIDYYFQGLPYWLNQNIIRFLLPNLFNIILIAKTNVIAKWVSTAISKDGKYMSALSSGYINNNLLQQDGIWVSSDFGKSWIKDIIVI